MDNNNETIRKELIKLLQKDITLVCEELLSEDELIFMICARVKQLLEEDRDLLMSYLYRLDVPASRINAAMRMTNQVPLDQSLGLLIYYRQLERIRTKRKYEVGPPLEGFEF
ncbi:MAG: hypothetical protein IPL23_10255 [Saprospiraceae bacterium]|nr:hypothetical protein [Saprospiraceae bacterium]MBK8633102.1 hypothetical protein [Saprospiraceae bacterium]MBP7644464.1 hypothetical protein [Saprospiraceae bacterium]HMS67325.1 hypothetical protein [Saprospiraceae bacterium]